MAKIFNIDKVLAAGPTLRIASDPDTKGFWLLSLVVNAQTVGSAIPVSLKEAQDFYLNLPGILQASISAQASKQVGSAVGIIKPLVSGVTISIQNDPTLVGFWNLSFSAAGQQIGQPVPITGPEASAITQDMKNLFFITLSN